MRVNMTAQVNVRQLLFKYTVVNMPYIMNSEGSSTS